MTRTEIDDYLILNYNKKGPRKLSKFFGVGERTVKRWAKKLELKASRAYIHTIYTVDDNFFAKPNIINSYIAGFILADGYIKGDRHIKIKIAIKDLDYLKNLAVYLCPNTPVKEYCYDGYGHCQVSINSKQMVTDLHNMFNVTYDGKKNITSTKPINLSKINELAFLVGFIDGDGCISSSTVPRRSKKQIGLHVCGSYKMVEWCRLKIKEITGTPASCISVLQGCGKLFAYKTTGKYVKAFKIHVLKTCNGIEDLLMKRKWDRVVLS